MYKILLTAYFFTGTTPPFGLLACVRLKPICPRRPGSGKSSNDRFFRFHGNLTPGRISVGCSHCLRRFYHARTVTEQESHYFVPDEWLFTFHCSCPLFWGQLNCKLFFDIFLLSCRPVLPGLVGLFLLFYKKIASTILITYLLSIKFTFIMKPFFEYYPIALSRSVLILLFHRCCFSFQITNNL